MGLELVVQLLGHLHVLHHHLHLARVVAPALLLQLLQHYLFRLVIQTLPAQQPLRQPSPVEALELILVSKQLEDLQVSVELYCNLLIGQPPDVVLHLVVDMLGQQT